MSNIQSLDVHLYHEKIGTITLLPDDRTIFAFEKSYIENTQRPILSLGFKNQYGGLITEHRPHKTKLLPYFSNLLPEGHLREYLASKAGVKNQREFFLLKELGQDLSGAVTVTPSDIISLSPDSLADAEEMPIASEQNLRFSLAGVQLKFSAIQGAQGGLTVPAQGIGGNWIVKLPSLQFQHVPENEYSMMHMAKALGMNVPDISLVDVKDIQNIPHGIPHNQGKAFTVKRFDRSGHDTLIHIEDFAQIFSVYPDHKYEKASSRNIASVLANEAGLDDVLEFIKRLVFNSLIGNADMHLKNWSLIYPDRYKASLAPAYDFVSTIAYIPDEKAALNFSRTKKFNELTLDELKHLATKASLPVKLIQDTALETVALFGDYWHKEKKHLPMTNDVTRAIDAHLKTVPLATET